MIRRLDRFQLWAVITTLATYGLIAVGGLVRAAGAGLGCPDWPRCYGRWVPPLSADGVPPGYDLATFNVLKTWTEYINRMLGVATGFLIFITLVLGIRYYRKVPRVLWPTVAAFLLVGVEGWLGGQVVLRELAPLVLSAHLALALVIVSLLLYATVCAFFDEGRPLDNLPPTRLQIGRAAFFVGCMTLMEIALGAFVRGHVQEAAKASPPIARAEWLAHAGQNYGVHRAFAVLVVLAVIALVYFVFERSSEIWLRRAAGATLILALIQPLAGLGLARFAVPRSLQVVHLWAATMLLGGLTVLVLLAYRLAPEAKDGVVADAGAKQVPAPSHPRSV